MICKIDMFFVSLTMFNDIKLDILINLKIKNMFLLETKNGIEIQIKSPKIINIKRKITFYNRIIEMYKKELSLYDDNDYKEYILQSIAQCERTVKNLKNKL
jgi:hypothetical protein